MNETEAFFRDLKKQYEKERSPFIWEWPITSSAEDAEEMVRFIAFNLAKNIMHGPLPGHLHSRIILHPGREWGKKYVEFLGS